ARDYRAGQVGGGRVDHPHREARFVATAPAAETLGIEDPEVDRRLLLTGRVAEVDGYPVEPGRHVERQLDIGLVIGAGEDAGQHQLARRRAGLGDFELGHGEGSCLRLTPWIRPSSPPRNTTPAASTASFTFTTVSNLA